MIKILVTTYMYSGDGNRLVTNVIEFDTIEQADEAAHRINNSNIRHVYQTALVLN